MKTDVLKVSQRSPVGCAWPYSDYTELSTRHPAKRSGKVRLLLGENSVHDELAILNELHQAGFEVSHKRVDTADDFLAELKCEFWDLIICDDSLRGSDGVITLRLFQALGLDVPFIMVSARMDDGLALDAIKAGASDYVMKRDLSQLVPAIKRELLARFIRYAPQEPSVASGQTAWFNSPSF